MTNEIRSARNEFRKNYSRETFNVIDYVSRGWSTERIADKMEIPETSVAAYRANLTRGTYIPYADINSKSGMVFGEMF